MLSAHKLSPLSMEADERGSRPLQKEREELVYLPVRECARLMGVSARYVQQAASHNAYEVRHEVARGGRRLLIALSSLPVGAQSQYWREQSPSQNEETAAEQAETTEHDLRTIMDAPEYNRRKAQKYLVLLQRTEGLRGKLLASFIEGWNRENPDLKTSKTSLYRMRADYNERGLEALVAGYGKTKNRSLAFEAAVPSSSDVDAIRQVTILERCYDTFRSLYLTEGAPAIKECWRAAYGMWCRESGGSIDLYDGSPFPAPSTFARRVEKEMSQDAIYLARFGFEAWNRKYARFADRDLTAIAPGEVWVMDHHQVDIAIHAPLLNVLAAFDRLRRPGAIKTDKIAFPWLTTVQDFRTGMILGWYLHVEAPNSDHIFQAVFHAASRYGLPRILYLDNGKDFRSRDFAGGRVRNFTLQFDERRATSFVATMGIQVVWATPYRAQSKLVERYFRMLKDGLAKFVVGYRGGDVTERPERLEREIASRSIMSWDQFVPVVDNYIENVLNTKPSEGKHLQGLSPKQAWTKFRTSTGYAPRKVGDDALALCCTRVGDAKRIGRNGYHDAQLDQWYYDHWMSGMKGERIYIRRDPRKWQTAWCFRADTHEYLGRAILEQPIPGIAETDLDRAHVREAIKLQAQDRKIAREMGRVAFRPDAMELVGLMSAANAALAPVDDDPLPDNVTHMTAADAVIQQDREQQLTGTHDIATIVPPDRPQKRVLRMFPDDDE